MFLNVLGSEEGFCVDLPFIQLTDWRRIFHAYVLSVVDFGFRYKFVKVAVDLKTTLLIFRGEIHCQ